MVKATDRSPENGLCAALSRALPACPTNPNPENCSRESSTPELGSEAPNLPNRTICELARIFSVASRVVRS